MKTKGKYEFIKEKYCEYNGEDFDKKASKSLFDRTLLAILELKACEDEYKNNEDEDFSYYHTFSDIDTEELNNFWEIEVNNQKALEVITSSERETMIPENDNSSINIKPFFEQYEENTSNKIIGAKFEIHSQMGYRIVKAEIDLDELKNMRNRIDEIIGRIEKETQSYTVIGHGNEYKFEKSLNYWEFPNEIEARTDELQCNHGLPENFKVIKVERNYLGDEKWHVEGSEEQISDHYKIKIEGYPCTFTFYSPKKFKKFNKKSDYDEERQSFLFAKMKKNKLPTNGHSYDDFVIENIEVVDGSEIWTLGS
jgi:hypothetical protein